MLNEFIALEQPAHDELTSIQPPLKNTRLIESMLPSALLLTPTPKPFKPTQAMPPTPSPEKETNLVTVIPDSDEDSDQPFHSVESANDFVWLLEYNTQ